MAKAANQQQQTDLVLLTESSARCLQGLQKLCEDKCIDASRVASQTTDVRWIRYHDDEYSQPDSFVTVLAKVVEISPKQLLISFPFVSGKQVEAIKGHLKTQIGRAHV